MFVGLAILCALLVCTLIPGTPVNGDPSPAAETAGIHLTTPVAHARVVTQQAAQLFAVIVAVATLLVAVGRRPIALPIGRTRRVVPRSLLRSWSGDRRGPPRFA